MDGVDAALVDLGVNQLSTIATLTEQYPDDVATLLRHLIEPQRATSLHEIATLTIALGLHFSNAVNRLLAESSTDRTDVIAIGSHGQTVRHSPSSDAPYSFQIGDAATIAARSGITTVADFRSLDVAYGGEGAPLVPAFHEWQFRTSAEDRVVLNIGGISNISILPADPMQTLAGYDTGPGNCLMDTWSWQHRRKPFDASGQWAASGQVSEKFLARLLDDPYIDKAPPKSTGRETYNLGYIATHIERGGFDALPPADVQATLLQFTVESIAAALERERTLNLGRIFACGGGVRNAQLMIRLRERLPNCEIFSTSGSGIDPDMVEATAFAWLASMRLANIPVSLTTGKAPRAIRLGAIYEPTPEQTI
jgi:anhydro-N-acetylmuramic acid kinase